jgi:hypothetical protein
MRKSYVVVKSLASVLFAVMTLSSSQIFAFGDHDRATCYLGAASDPQNGIFDAFNFNVKEHSSLYLKRSYFDFDYGTQKAYTAMGKTSYTDENNSNNSFGADVYGTVYVDRHMGAQMAITRTALWLPSTSGEDWVQHWKCESTEASPTPKIWDCRYQQVRWNGSTTLNFFGNYTLERADLREPGVRDACIAAHFNF